MAQHDYVIDNSTGANVRADINNVLQAIVTNNSTSDIANLPATFPSMLVADANAGIMKLRNTSNNGFVNLFTLAGGIDVDAASTFSEDVTFEGSTSGKNIVFDRSDNALEFNDNAKATFGTGSDLEIFHNGTRSEIQNNTGDLIIQASENNKLMLRAQTGESHLIGYHNAQVELYYDGGKKLETYSHGIKANQNIHIQGSAYLDDADVSNSTGILHFGDSQDLQIYHNGSVSRIQDVGTGQLEITTNGSSIDLNKGLTEYMGRFKTDGAVELYYDNGKKLSTTANGIKLDDDTRIGIGNGEDLQLYHDGADSYIVDHGTGNLRVVANNFILLNRAETQFIMKGIDGGATELYHAGDKKFDTNSSGCSVLGSLTVAGSIFPSNDHASLNLGSANFRWTTVFAANGSINTSDKNEKNTIVESDLGLDFINKLKPISYKWNKDDGKTHYGLIAQDLEETLTSLGKTIADFGGIYKEDESPMGLGYSELIAPLIKAVQELSAEVASLKAS